MCVCVLLQFILIKIIDVTEMSNEALDRAVLSDKWRRKYSFLLHRLRCWHRYLFFTFFVPVNDVSRLVLYSNFFRMYKMLYLLHDKNRYLQRCIAISNCFFEMSKIFRREWSLQLQRDERKILTSYPRSYFYDKQQGCVYFNALLQK